MKRSDGADVVIVGAGPAGATAALLLARAGHDVLLLERAAFPRAKPCGDCLSLGADSVLLRLGLFDRVVATHHARLRGWRVSAPDGSTFEAEFRSAGRAFAVERAILDNTILDAAIEAGARIERLRVTDVLRDRAGRVIGVCTPDGQRRAPVTIGADGLRSVVAARLDARGPAGPVRKLSLTLHFMMPELSAFGELHVGDGICAGIARIDASGRCNLTIVADTARYGRAVARDARGFVTHALASLPGLRDRIPGDAVHGAMLASGPFHRPVRRRAFDGAVLVGDAAGYYDPFTGQGVFQAIAAAEILAPHVDHAVRRGTTAALAFRGYERERTALLRGPGIVQRAIETVVSRPALANHAIRRIAHAPAFARTIVAVTGDAAPASALLAPRTLSALLHTHRRPENIE